MIPTQDRHRLPVLCSLQILKSVYMNIYLERAGLLLEQGRLAEAEKEIKNYLAQEPTNPFGLAMLAEVYLRQERYAEALSPAQQAVSNNPEWPWFYYILARAWFFNREITKAREALDEGLRLDPGDSSFYLMQAVIAIYESKWQEALDAAESGLALDPEDVNLLNMRTEALVKLNRTGEAAETIDFALKQDPEDAASHASKGWVNLHKGKYDEALGNFRESLRFDPGHEFARAGLKEAIKAKNVLYRWIFRYFLWISKLSERNQWVFIIGLYVVYRILLSVVDQYPGLQPLVMPLIVAYIIFAFSSWIAKPVSNLFLRLHPLGKFALDEDEVKGSNLAGLLLGAALLAFTGLLFTQNLFFALLAGFFFFMMIPAAGMYNVKPGGKARQYLRLYAIAMAVIGLTAIFVPQNGFALPLFGLGIFAYGFVANYFAQKDARLF